MNEIEKAIKHFENMRDENIAVLNTGFGDKPNEHNTLYANRKLYADLAIQALYEKQERDKMKCENCKYCLIDLSERKYHICMENPIFRHNCELTDFCSRGERKDGEING